VSYVYELLKKIHFSASVVTEDNYFILKANLWSQENFCPQQLFYSYYLCHLKVVLFQSMLAVLVVKGKTLSMTTITSSVVS